MGQFVQGKGSAEFATVEYGDAITAVDFRFARPNVDLPATLATGERDTEPGPLEIDVTVSFMTELAADSFHEALYDAIESTGEIAFDIVMSDDAVSADNPRRTGTAVVTELGFGGTVGSVRSQDRTFRVKAGTYTKASV